MTKQQHLRTEEFRRRLETERIRTLELLEVMENRGLGEPETYAVSELSSYDQHSADLGSETFEREKDIGLRENARAILSAIDEALQRLEKGTYGVCEVCGRRIDPERLRALPYTSVCMSCKILQDAGRDPTKRSVEEDVLNPPFGRTFMDDADYTGYDGEDAWQDLAKYGAANSPQDAPSMLGMDEAWVESDDVESLQDIEDIEDIEVEPDDREP